MQHFPMPLKAMRRLPLLVASAFFMQMLDSTILNTAIPGIGRSFHASPLELHMLVISYTLAVCALLPASGWVADRWGTRRVMLFAIALFTVGSLLCALSTSVAMMTTCRVIQGLGGAFLAPVGRLIVLKSYPRYLFVKVFSFITIPGLLGPLLGPPLGGLLVQFASWHWIFLINIPIGVIGFYYARALMPDLRGERNSPFDTKGFFLFAVSVLLMTLCIDQINSSNGPFQSIVSGTVGLALQIAYWRHAYRSPAPLFKPSLFRIKNFSIGIVGNIVCRLGGSCVPYLIPLYFQVVLGYSAFKSGFSLIPMALCNVLTKTWVARFLHTFGYRRILIGNTLVIALTLSAFACVSPRCPEWILLVQLAVLGTANAIQFTSMNTLTLIDLPYRSTAGGNAVLSVVMQLSVAISIAFAAMLLECFGGRGDAPLSAVGTAFRAVFVTISAICACSSLIFSRVDSAKGKIASRL